MINDRIDNKPWFKYFWPWVFLFIMLWTLMSGIGMLYFSNISKPSLVPGYNKIAKFTFEDKIGQQNARRLGIQAILTNKNDRFYLNVYPAQYNKSKKLILKLIHPLDQTRDIKINLTKSDIENGVIIPKGTMGWQIILSDSVAKWSLIAKLALMTQFK